jgi:chromosome segregation ATPase
LEQLKKLQQFVYFEAGVRPHIAKLDSDVASLKAQAAEHEAKIAEMEAAIKSPSAVADQTTNEGREAKLAEIRDLEEQYEQLLARKAKLLELGEQHIHF